MSTTVRFRFCFCFVLSCFFFMSQRRKNGRTVHLWKGLPTHRGMAIHSLASFSQSHQPNLERTSTQMEKSRRQTGQSGQVGRRCGWEGEGVARTSLLGATASSSCLKQLTVPSLACTIPQPCTFPSPSCHIRHFHHPHRTRRSNQTHRPGSGSADGSSCWTTTRCSGMAMDGRWT